MFIRIFRASTSISSAGSQDKPDNKVYFVSQPNENFMVGVTKVIYTVDRPPQLNCHPYTVEFDTAVRVGVSVANVCRDLKSRGVIPDIIIGHCGWGETLFLRDVYPDTPVLSYFEFYYHFSNVDVGFDPEFSLSNEDPFRLRTRNTINLLSFDATDWGNTPTLWQQSVIRRRCADGFPCSMKESIRRS